MAFSKILLVLPAASSLVWASPSIMEGEFNAGTGGSFGIPGNATYDYVVVGGGTAGLAVAYRLAEDGTHTVAVIEAGGFYQIEAGNKSVVPAYNPEFASLQDPDANPLIDWGFVTTPQPGANNRTMHYARGKTLGGSSALNANVYNRGTRQAYQMWADAVGDSSYTFDKWLPYFANGVSYTTSNNLRAPNSTVPTPASDAEDFSPCGGLVHVSHSNFALPFSSWAQRAFLAFGFANISSLSNGKLLGSQWAPNVLRPITNERETSSTAYLDTALRSKRVNLQVYTHTLALKVLFSENKTATAVVVKSGKMEYVLSGRKEIVISAGAFQSPQLLMVSGVGPAAALQQHDIEVLVDRPGVGQNMWDHIDVQVSYKVDVVGFNTLNNETYAQIQKDRYHSKPAISMYGSYGADYLGFEKLPPKYRAKLSPKAISQLDEFPHDWPNIEYEIASDFQSGTPGDYSGYGSFIVIPVSPLSRGSIRLNSSSMEDPPIIDPQWLTAQTDIELVVQAVKRARSILASKSFDPIRIGSEYEPGDSINTDALLEQYIRNNFFMNWHASCTCKMGRANDTTAVVDSRARVIGVQNLRVVDASAFALLPPGHPISTVYGLAEKISADIIKCR